MAIQPSSIFIGMRALKTCICHWNTFSLPLSASHSKYGTMDTIMPYRLGFCFRLSTSLYSNGISAKAFFSNGMRMTCYFDTLFYFLLLSLFLFFLKLHLGVQRNLFFFIFTPLSFINKNSLKQCTSTFFLVVND